MKYSATAVTVVVVCVLTVLGLGAAVTVSVVTGFGSASEGSAPALPVTGLAPTTLLGTSFVSSSGA